MLHALHSRHVFHSLAGLLFACLRRFALLLLLGYWGSWSFMLHTLYPLHAFHLVAFRFGAGLRWIGLGTLLSRSRRVSSVLSAASRSLPGTRRCLLCRRTVALLRRIRLRLRGQCSNTTDQREGNDCCLELGHRISLPLREIVV